MILMKKDENSKFIVFEYFIFLIYFFLDKLLNKNMNKKIYFYQFI